ncbi:hypothetical protein PPL_11228 [Heterostelium album PN500]|uniref:Uncharacterized protein n=1 Tax=Heterostelium pallidum (strain ATCC 26659 / Pp 5 / PN500) TaxID=670386 RepID=D3BTW8_HETP5|nr:hypothetical protein PPL_11228 [Heterostelium album PN500]EFA75154.1 hypothetical protein PPL_11228 [Heterostelium album PN500]|eukprot:XP_020427288.1 hypothetical protein PPL_11228 [Heterostelium album PN500]
MKSIILCLFVILLVQGVYSNDVCSAVRCLGGLQCASINGVATCISKLQTVQKIAIINPNATAVNINPTNYWADLCDWYTTISNFYFAPVLSFIYYFNSQVFKE